MRCKGTAYCSFQHTLPVPPYCSPLRPGEAIPTVPPGEQLVMYHYRLLIFSAVAGAREFRNSYQPRNEFTITCESPMIESFARIPADQPRLRMLLSGSWKNE